MTVVSLNQNTRKRPESHNATTVASLRKRKLKPSHLGPLPSSICIHTFEYRILMPSLLHRSQHQRFFVLRIFSVYVASRRFLIHIRFFSKKDAKVLEAFPTIISAFASALHPVFGMYVWVPSSPQSVRSFFVSAVLFLFLFEF